MAGYLSKSFDPEEVAAASDAASSAIVYASGASDTASAAMVKAAAASSKILAQSSAWEAGGGGHAAVTLSADAGANLLQLDTQQIGLDPQTANYLFAGPASGGAVAPTFRAMVAADLGTGLTPTFAGLQVTGSVTLGLAGGSVILGGHDAGTAYYLERYSPSYPYASITAGSADNNVPVALSISYRDADGSPHVGIYLNETGFVGIGTINQLCALCINGGLHVGGDSDAGDNNLLVDGTISGASIKVAGAEQLKIWTYTYTLVAQDITNTYATITISAVTLLKVRGISAVMYVSASSVLTNLANYLSYYQVNSTTTLKVYLGASAAAGNILGVTIIEAV